MRAQGSPGLRTSASGMVSGFLGQAGLAQLTNSRACPCPQLLGQLST